MLHASCRPGPSIRGPSIAHLEGSDTFGRYQSGIPTHRYGGPGNSYFGCFNGNATAKYVFTDHIIGEDAIYGTRNLLDVELSGIRIGESTTLAPFLGPISRTTHPMADEQL